MEVRVRENGKSEGHLVMRWIGIAPKATSSHAKAGANGTFDDFHMVSHHKRVCQTVTGRKADGSNETDRNYG